MKSDRASPSRATRFLIGLPLKYREAGAADWHDGMTLNMSKSGVLFRAEKAFAPQTSIEIELTLPLVLPGRPAAKIAGRGTVVRSLLAKAAGPGFVVAAAIKSRHFVPDGGELGHSGETSGTRAGPPSQAGPGKRN